MGNLRTAWQDAKKTVPGSDKVYKSGLGPLLDAAESANKAFTDEKGKDAKYYDPVKLTEKAVKVVSAVDKALPIVKKYIPLTATTPKLNSTIKAIEARLNEYSASAKKKISSPGDLAKWKADRLKGVLKYSGM
ncbi:MAG: hypothetical protein HBSAPP03_23830 [Phycisphaerae bacterium]|nr:MAG: hypothetical protein HBSAPP03_23830 [Phycisphaerae bacterium]